MNKVFLGGTWEETTWREELIPLLTIDYFNPIVEDWNESCQVEEEQQKLHYCNIHLYVITKEMTGVFSIAEAIESAMTKGKITIFQVIYEGFSKSQIKSLDAVCNMIKKHGGIAYMSWKMTRTAEYINKL